MGKLKENDKFNIMELQLYNPVLQVKRLNGKNLEIHNIGHKNVELKSNEEIGHVLLEHIHPKSIMWIQQQKLKAKDELQKFEETNPIIVDPQIITHF